MGAEAPQESSWLGSWRMASCKGPMMEPVKSTAVVGPLTHDIMSLMSKLIVLWNSLSDMEIARLREVVLNSAGVRKLVSDEDDLLGELILNEMIENWVHVAKYVSRLGEQCKDPVAIQFESFLKDPDENDLACYEWEYKSRKMERKVKKIERLIGMSMQLNQELEVLAEMEQISRRMHVKGVKRVKLLEFQQKLMWQSQMVKDIRDKSLWNRTYDYTFRLMARSLFTILNRLKETFGATGSESLVTKLTGPLNSVLTPQRCQSFPSVVHSVVCPNENDTCITDSEPIKRSILISFPEKGEVKKKIAKAHNLSTSSFSGKNFAVKSKSQVHAGPFKVCMFSDFASPSPLTCKPTLGGSMRLNSFRSKKIDTSTIVSKPSMPCKSQIHSKIRQYNTRRNLPSHPQNTLGDAGLALHYANVIILIEKLASAPHLIGQDARDDLYKKLPTTVKSDLRSKLKPCTKALASCSYDIQLAKQWKSAVAQILEWLAPLAHDTIRWQSERNFEKQQSSSRTNALLVQTLHYANQRKTEAAITELLLGLNFLCRFGALVESKKKLIPDEYMLQTEIVVL
uniref:Uncharacterized protein n=1 Tax=Kalanchoe fedtschenkoi TaxID=63787 RepID=A0A7N0UAZ2_KALFE